MGQELSGQHHQKPPSSEEVAHNEHSTSHPSGAPPALPPIHAAPKQSSEQSHDDHSGSRSGDRSATSAAKPHADLPAGQRSVDHYPIADDPVIPFNTVEPVAPERSAAAPASGATRSLSPPTARPLPRPQDTHPFNPHLHPMPMNAHHMNATPPRNRPPAELPPIVQVHRAAAPAPRKGVLPQTSAPSSALAAAPPAPPAASSSQDPASKTFTEAEIQSILAIDPSRLIVIIKKHVYDVTHFVDAHPGGPSVLRRNNGKDITDAFFMMHSPHTADRLPEFLMGRLVTEAERNPASVASTGNKEAEHELSMKSIQQMLKEDPNRLILIMFGDAYDVTPMRNDHRGGLRVLLNYNGKECGDIFMRVHGLHAKRQVHDYFMGRVPELGNAPSPLMRFAEKPPAPVKTGRAINPRVQSTRILEKEKMNAAGTLMSFTFSCPKPLRMTPGGHLKIYSDVERDEWRYYTPYLTEVASFRLCVKRYAKGRTSKYLCDQPTGREIFYEGPFSPSWELQMDSYVKKAPLEQRHILLLAGGTGIAPMYSIANHELEKQTASVTLVCSVHTPNDLLLAEEMNRLVKRYESPLPGQQHTLRVALVFSRVPSHVPVPRTAVKSPALVRCGTHVDGSFLQALKLPPTQAAVLCGPPAFNDALAETVLQAGICPVECIHAL